MGHIIIGYNIVGSNDAAKDLGWGQAAIAVAVVIIVKQRQQ